MVEWALVSVMAWENRRRGLPARTLAVCKPCTSSSLTGLEAARDPTCTMSTRYLLHQKKDPRQSTAASPASGGRVRAPVDGCAVVAKQTQRRNALCEFACMRHIHVQHQECTGVCHGNLVTKGNITSSRVRVCICVVVAVGNAVF